MYIHVDESFPKHRKTIRFCALLRDRNAGMYLVRLWTWAARSVPDGDISGLTPEDIEIASEYGVADGSCYTAMAAAGFIDEAAPGRPAALHNWMERTGTSLAQMEAAAEASRERKRVWREKEKRRREEEERGRNAGQDAVGTGTERGTGRETADVEASPERGTAPPRPGQTRPGQARPDLDQDQGGSEAPARTAIWGPSRWNQKFGQAWAEAKNRLAYGDAGDSKACATLGDLLERLPIPEVLAAQEIAPAMFAAFLADTSPAVTKAEHPFAFFVTRFSALRINPGRVGAPPRDIRVGSVPASADETFRKGRVAL